MGIYLKGVRLITFEELGSKATDMENYMQHISQQTRSPNKLEEKNGQRDKFPTKPKQMQAVETTITPQKYHTRVPPWETRTKEAHQFLGGPPLVSVRTKNIPSWQKKRMTSSWVFKNWTS